MNEETRKDLIKQNRTRRMKREDWERFNQYDVEKLQLIVETLREPDRWPRSVALARSNWLAVTLRDKLEPMVNTLDLPLFQDEEHDPVSALAKIPLGEIDKMDEPWRSKFINNVNALLELREETHETNPD